MAIILFEGSLSLNFSKIKSVSSVVILLITVGLAITVVLTALFCYYVVGLNLELSMLIGGITCVSGPTVVPPFMRTVRPKTYCKYPKMGVYTRRSNRSVSCSLYASMVCYWWQFC